ARSHDTGPGGNASTVYASLRAGATAHGPPSLHEGREARRSMPVLSASLSKDDTTPRSGAA
ncbi:MAG: hypothetical protein ACK53Y_05025, partial [bacterium]